MVSKETKVICQGFTGKQVGMLLDQTIEFDVNENMRGRGPGDRPQRTGDWLRDAYGWRRVTEKSRNNSS